MVSSLEVSKVIGSPAADSFVVLFLTYKTTSIADYAFLEVGIEDPTVYENFAKFVSSFITASE